MLPIILTIIFLVVYWYCPKYLKVLLLLVNVAIPDAVPFVDELIMAVGLLKKEE